MSVCPSVRPSVCPPLTLFKLNQSTWNFLHFFLKPNQELSSKMGKIGQIFFLVMGTWLSSILGLWAKNKFCPIDRNFSTLVFLVNKNDFWKNYKIWLKIKKPTVQLCIARSRELLTANFYIYNLKFLNFLFVGGAAPHTLAEA